MPSFDMNEAELLTFFAVLCRYGALFALMPILSDRAVPGPVKALFTLVLSIALFPTLAKTGVIPLSGGWTESSWGVVSTIFSETLVGLVFGFVAKYAFEVIQYGSGFIATMAGFSTASMYDPHQESQTEVLSRFQMALATLLFLALEGHHLLIRAAVESYRVLGLGQASITRAVSGELISLTGEIIRIGLQLSAPVAIVIFAVNVVYGVMAKSMPQMNVLVLSFSISTLIGLGLLLALQPEFFHVFREAFERTFEHLVRMLKAMKA